MVGRKRNPVHPALLGSALRLARATFSSVVGHKAAMPPLGWPREGPTWGGFYV